MDINHRLTLLRNLMEENDLKAYIVNTSDPHSSEYLADRYKSREWISGFTGSAGVAIITMDQALLWTDGRYFVQAEGELKDTEYKLMKMGIPGYPTYYEWLETNLEDGDMVGLDGEIYSQLEYENLKRKLKPKSIKINANLDLINEIWTNRPEMPKSKVFILEEKYAGKRPLEKIEEVREKLKEKKATGTIIGSLDDIAWLFNIRGRDIKNNPVVFAYAFVGLDEVKLFIDNEKIDGKVKNHLKENNIDILEYKDIGKFVKEIDIEETLYLDKSRINRRVFSNIPREIKIKHGIDITTRLKAIKNEIEIKNQEKAYIKDGVALTKFLYWLDTNVESENITEIDAEKKLLEFRQEQEGFLEPSFDTISAYGPNAAMMHYSADENSNATIEPKGLYLVDSGGQYFNGTTDITRTVAVGPLTEEEIKDCTLAFKGHTMLIGAKFLYGATGHSLDALARYPLWQEYSDYKSGTGHGIGFMLNVHEGPHNIAPRVNNVVLEPGMITSIEPGVYKEGKHGIRLENIAVVEKDLKNDSGQFLKFRVLSYVPIDLRTIDKNLLNEREITWLNQYHERVYEKLSPYMNEDEKDWLKKQTKRI